MKIDYSRISDPMWTALNQLSRHRHALSPAAMVDVGPQTLRALRRRGLVKEASERYSINDAGREALRWRGRNP